jgi:hypothetical protein
MRASLLALAWLCAAGFLPGCGPGVDLARTLQLHAIASGWVDTHTVDGRTKLVPTFTFTLKNRSDQKLPMLQVNALFRRVGDESEWGTTFVTAAGSAGLGPGDTTPLTVTSPVGYTGTDSRTALLAHSQFVDARVDVFARYGSAQWTRLGRFHIARELLNR